MKHALAVGELCLHLNARAGAGRAVPSPGGTPAFVLLQLRELGFQAEALVAAGPDEAGDRAVGLLRAEAGGVCDVRSGSRTAVAHIVADGERTALRIESSDVDPAVLAASLAERPLPGLVHLPAFPGMDAALEALAGRGCPVVADFGYIPFLGSAARLRAHVLPRLKGVEVAILNGARSDVREMASLADACCGEGVPVVFTTFGARGVRVTTRRRSAHLPAAESAPVNTVGAGDAFTAGALSVLWDGGDPFAAAAFGQCVAAAKIERMWRPADLERIGAKVRRQEERGAERVGAAPAARAAGPAR